MRPLISFIILFLLLLTRRASADISFQLGTEAQYNPDAVCWQHPSNRKLCKPADSAAGADPWRCEWNERSSGTKISECLTDDEVAAKKWRKGVCNDDANRAAKEPTAPERRVLLTFRGIKNINRVELVGSVVRIFTEATSGGIFVSEGDFIPPVPQTVLAKDSVAFTQLTPTCRTVLVDVPDAPGTLSFADSPSPAQCVDVRCRGGGLQKVLINTGPRGQRNVLTATITDDRNPFKGQSSTLKGEWSGAIPDAIKLRFTTVQFAWTGSCLYEPKCAVSPGGTPTCDTPCPTARIPGAAIDEERCGQELINGTCAYTCAQGQGNSGFSLPIDVVFEIGSQKDRWIERLVQNGQSFTGFAERADRQFRVIFPDEDVKRGVHRVTEVNLQAPNGMRFDVPWVQGENVTSAAAAAVGAVAATPSAAAGARVADSRAARPAQATRISVPGTTCHDRLVAQYFAEFQAFKPDLVELTKGEFRLHPPSESFRDAWFGVRLSGAFSHRLTSSAWLGAGEIEFIAEKRWYDLPWTAGFAVAYQLLNHGYEPIGYDPRVDNTPAKLLLHRVSLAATGSRHLGGRFHVYWANGVWVSWPVNEDDYPLAGIHAGARMDVGLHVLLVRAFSAQLGGALYLPDPIRRISADAPSSSPTFTTDWSPSFMVKLGFGGWMPL